MDGLTDGDLNLARAPGHWTIRQIVNHLADGDVISLPALRLALAESGRAYVPNHPNSSIASAQGLDWAGRGIQPAVILFRAIRSYVAHLAQNLPGAWERVVKWSDGCIVSFGDMVYRDARHSLEHIEEIREIRRAHGR